MRRYRWTSFIPLLILLGAVALRFYDPQWATEALRNYTFDTFERLAPRTYHDAGVRIVDLDDETLARLGQWPWPRTQVAHLIDRLGALGAAAIALDIVFAEPDRTSPRNILPLWKEQAGSALPDDLADRLPDHDEVLAKSIAATPTVLGMVLTDDKTPRPPQVWGLAQQGADVRPFLQQFAGAVKNLPVLEAHARGIGVFNSDADSDGIVRHVPLLFDLRAGSSASDSLYPALGPEALRLALNASTYVVRGSGASDHLDFGANAGMVGLKIGPLDVPTDEHGAVRLYDTGAIPERTIPAWQIFEPGFDASRIAGTIVFIGTSAPGLVDLRTTALRKHAPGVEVHAEIAEEILLASGIAGQRAFGGQLLHRPALMTGIEIVWVLVFGGALLLALRRIGPSWAAVVGIIAVTASFTASWMAFRRFDLLVDPVYPTLTALAIYLSQSLLHYIRTENDRRFLKNAFGLYLSPAQVAKLAADPSHLRLGGETREMSVMFCDIRGFTSISETMDAEALTQFINSFLTPMTAIIQEGRRGTIDKYIGDCIMAFWNAPLEEVDHAELAVRAALDMTQDLMRLNRKWIAEADTAGRSFKGIGIGIGIATGPCCVGNLGSDQRLNYSLLGDDVNLASRLEGQSKTYGLEIIISEATFAELSHFATLELDLLRVKGKAQPRRVYGVLGNETVAGESWFRDLVTDHEAMLMAFRAQRWSEAAALAARLHDTGPVATRGLYALYRDRIDEFQSAPPPEDWDGVIVAHSK